MNVYTVLKDVVVCKYGRCIAFACLQDSLSRMCIYVCGRGWKGFCVNVISWVSSDVVMVVLISLIINIIAPPCSFLLMLLLLPLSSIATAITITLNFTFCSTDGYMPFSVHMPTDGGYIVAMNTRIASNLNLHSYICTSSTKPSSPSPPPCCPPQQHPQQSSYYYY